MNGETVVVGVFTALCALLGTYLSNRKQAALMDYRLEQLEKKVGRHNNLEGRTIALEEQVKDIKQMMKV